jgi:hypothetical protein
MAFRVRVLVQRYLTCPQRPCLSPTAMSPTATNDFGRPSGTELSGSIPRHFVPGYDQPVLPGQNYQPVLRDKSHSPIEGPRIKLALMGLNPGLSRIALRLRGNKLP